MNSHQQTFEQNASSDMVATSKPPRFPVPPVASVKELPTAADIQKAIAAFTNFHLHVYQLLFYHDLDGTPSMRRPFRLVHKAEKPFILCVELNPDRFPLCEHFSFFIGLPSNMTSYEFDSRFWKNAHWYWMRLRQKRKNSIRGSVVRLPSGWRAFAR